jgi:hypothetical protein
VLSRLVVNFEHLGVFKGEEALRSDFDTFFLAWEGLVSFSFLLVGFDF